eukprot:1257039-Pyramimonas_sp.AAC.1
MHDDQKTMQDLRQQLKLDLVEIYIDWRRLQFLGHQMRLPPERLDRQNVWLHPEEEFTSAKTFGGARLRIRTAFSQKVEALT